MNAFVLAAIGIAAGGLLLRRAASPVARWTAWWVALAFAVACLALPAPEWRHGPVAVAARELDGSVAGMRTEVLAAAATAGPRADDLRLRWQRGEVPPGDRAVGAWVTMPNALPLQPESIQVRTGGVPQRGRPVALQLESPVLAAPIAGELHVADSTGVVLREVASVGAGTVTIEFVPERVGEYRVEWVAAIAGHTVRAGGVIDVAPPAAVLVLDGDAAIAAALRAQGVEVVAAAELPARLDAFAAVLVPRPLPAAAQAALATAVRDGLGAFVLGPAFGAPGEPLRDLLPVRPFPVAAATGDTTGAGTGERPADPAAAPLPDGPPRGDTSASREPTREPIEVDKRAIAMVLVVDRSGSMGARLADGRTTKMSLAKTSALRTAQALGAGDVVGIVTFGNKDQPVTVLPMTDAAQLATVRAGIERLAHASEQTFLLGGIRQAHALLQPVVAGVKHVVVITDGEFRTEEEIALGAEANRMRGNGISVSIISIVDGDTDPQFLAAAERMVPRQFFQVTDATAVPALVSAEVTRSLTRAGRAPKAGNGAGDAASPRPGDAVPSPSTTPTPAPAPAQLVVRAVAQSTLLAPQPATWPTLGAAVAGTAPLDAQVLLIAGEDGWPLLAFANRGLGRVGAFAADLAGAAGTRFRAEAAFPARLASWVQHVVPAQPTNVSAPRLREFSITPPAPTPNDAAALAQLAGGPPAALDAEPPSTPAWRRELRAATAFAPWLVALLVLLAAVERLARARSLRG